MLHLFQQAVNPALSLRNCLEDWQAIALDLREPRRKRVLQATKLEQCCAILS
jgi:hypothetical protein